MKHPAFFNDNFTGSRFLLGIPFREFRFFFVCLREKPELPEKGRVTSFMEALILEDKIDIFNSTNVWYAKSLLVRAYCIFQFSQLEKNIFPTREIFFFN